MDPVRFRNIPVRVSSGPLAAIILFGLLTGCLFEPKEPVSRHTEENGLHLIPSPRILLEHEGRWNLDRVPVFVEEDSEENRFAAECLLEEMEKQGLKAGRIQSWNGCGVFLGRLDESRIPREAAEDRGRIGSQGYFLGICEDSIIVLANTYQGLFYGVQTLKQIFRTSRCGSLPCLTIVDWPALEIRAWQDDISRGPIPTLNFLKEQIRILSEFKYNAMTLYTEHVFKFKGHPGIAPKDGITAEEIRELARYGKKHHVELIGNFQSFGHFTNILKLEAYRSLAETEHVISPAKEESYEFLKEVLPEIAAAYPGPWFHVNCDEISDLGTGPAKGMLDSLGTAGVYAYHINRLHQILAPLGKKLLIWGDIVQEHPEIIDLLPDDITVLSWAYDARESFEAGLEPVSESGIGFWVCPGVNCWGRMWPDHEESYVNIAHFVRDGVRLKARGMLNTSWDNDGENLFNNHWIPLLWGGECSWNPAGTHGTEKYHQRVNRFESALEPLLGLGKGTAKNILSLSRLAGFESSGDLLNSLFWSPLIGAGPPELWEESDIDSLQHDAEVIRNGLQSASRDARPHPLIEGALFAARKASIFASKLKLQASLVNPPEGSGDSLLKELDAFKKQILELKREYRRLWLLENRRWWLDRNLAKYNDLAKTADATRTAVAVVPDHNLFAPVRSVTLIPYFDADSIVYTTDGSDPKPESSRCRGPFKLERTASVKVRSYSKGRPGSVWSKEIDVLSGFVHNLTLAEPYSELYPARGLISLVDGRQGGASFRDPEWQGYHEIDLDAVIDFGKSVGLKSASLRFLQETRSWILFPLWVEYSISPDCRSFEVVERIQNRQNLNQEGTRLQDFPVALHGKKFRYLRVHAKNIGRLPDWHRSAGGRSWIFADEIRLIQSE